jgi:DNA end-binding protein Ku
LAARSIWNGTIAFGEVAVPVKLFSAVSKGRIQFREVRLRDGSRITHRRFGAESGEEVPSERIRKAYEISPGRQVLVTDEEIAAVLGPNPKTIELRAFVKVSEIDPVYYDKPYIVGAQNGGERAYRVLHAALAKTSKAGVGHFMLRSREQLVALAPHGDALRLYTMRYADELVRSAELDLTDMPGEPSARELTMAQALIGTLAEPWEPERFEDRHREAVMAVIRQKAGGGEVELPAPVVQEAAPDLIEALRASLERSGPRKPAPKRKPGPGKAGAGKAGPSKAGPSRAGTSKANSQGEKAAS